MKILKTVLSYVLIIGIAILIKLYVFSPIRVNGTSMDPTLNNGDIMILNEIGYHLNGLDRFDIVVINSSGEKIIKRVIGLPGETVAYRNNKLYINDKEVVENFKHQDTKDFELSSLNVKIIPRNYYFVVGDNRGNSKDSRSIGLINKKQIMGKASFILYPFNRIGNVQ